MPAPQGYVALDLVGFTDKGDYAEGTTYAQNDLVHNDNKIYLSLQDNNTGQALPVSPATETSFWRLWLSGGADDLEALTAEDTSNVTGGGAGQVVVAQTLIDAIANKVMNDLVAKSQIVNNLLATQAGNVLDATQGKALKDLIDQTNSDLNSRNDVSDLLAEADMGRLGKRIVMCGMNTLNTPYKAGLTLGAEGVAYINMTNDNYGTILFITSGGDEVFCRYKNNGTWSPEWSKFVTNADLDGHLVFLSGGETALEAGSGNTRYRLQIDTAGNVLIFKSTDGGSTWPTSKVIASM